MDRVIKGVGETKTMTTCLVIAAAAFSIDSNRLGDCSYSSQVTNAA